MISSCDKCGSDVVPKFRLTRISVIREPLWYHECTNCKKAFMVEDSDLFYSNRVADAMVEYRMKVLNNAQEYM